MISIHALLAESDARRASRQQPAGISIHALLAESDESIGTLRTVSVNFYPRSPCGERLSARREARESIDFYPRSPCGERPRQGRRLGACICISIHALLAESAPPVRDIIQWEGIFLSTLSLRRATLNSSWISSIKKNFYPRSPCGERPSQPNLPGKN